MTSLGVQALPRTSTEGTISEPVGCYTNMADWTTDERLMLERETLPELGQANHKLSGG